MYEIIKNNVQAICFIKSNVTLSNDEKINNYRIMYISEICEEGSENVCVKYLNLIVNIGK